ncbi:glycosyltransferase family A protein [Caenimonas sp. SL110]|uniref:glycosyltransferase family 2 protein n=1 Tax=Caenimonas sp. SL110 TaxID=1450524 RepID=UPI00065405CA|nr:glycosyltransferase family A protein [Caenimonas sp. SL110]
MNPRVSIIVPVFNAAPFLEETIASVKAQTFDAWELLLIDDGSTDASTGIIERARASDPLRVRVLSHEGRINRGLPASRNLGLQEARGPYIALLDADDVWHSDKLARQVELLDQHPQAAMLMGPSEYWRSWNPDDPEPDSTPTLAPGPKTYAPPELRRLTYPFGPCGSPCPSNLMIRVDAARAVGGFAEEFSGDNSAWEDIAFLSRIFMRYPVHVTDQCWDRYRIHSRSMSARLLQDEKQEAVREYFFAWFDHYMRSNGLNDAHLQRQTRSATWRYRHPLAWRLYRALRSRARPLKRLMRGRTA